MANLETQILDDIIVKSRRKLLTLGGTALAGLAFAGVTARRFILRTSNFPNP